MSARLPPALGRRAFLGHAVALGAGAGAARGLLPAESARAAADTTQKRDLVILQASDLHALDPHASTYSSDIRVAFDLFDGLVRRHPDGTLHPPWRRRGSAPGRPPGTSPSGGRPLARREPLHSGRRQVQPRPDVRSEREGGPTCSSPRGWPAAASWSPGRTSTGFIANDRPMTEAITEMWEDVGVNVVVEVIDPAVRNLKMRQQTFKGLW